MATVTEVQEKQGLLDSENSKGGVAVNYGSVRLGNPRICLVFSDSFLGGKRSAWLVKLKNAGFEVEQSSPRFVAISASEDMLHRCALAKGSHGQHTMPATRERVLHLLLCQFDESLATFLSPPGPFSGKLKYVSRRPRIADAFSPSSFCLTSAASAAAASCCSLTSAASRGIQHHDGSPRAPLRMSALH